MGNDILLGFEQSSHKKLIKSELQKNLQKRIKYYFLIIKETIFK